MTRSWEELGFFHVSCWMVTQQWRHRFYFDGWQLKLRIHLPVSVSEDHPSGLGQVEKSGVIGAGDPTRVSVETTLILTLDHGDPGPLQMRSPQPRSQHSSYGSFLIASGPQQHPYHSSLDAFGVRSPHLRSISGSCAWDCRICWLSQMQPPRSLFICVFRF